MRHEPRSIGIPLKRISMVICLKTIESGRSHGVLFIFLFFLPPLSLFLFSFLSLFLFLSFFLSSFNDVHFSLTFSLFFLFFFVSLILSWFLYCVLQRWKHCDCNCCVYVIYFLLYFCKSLGLMMYCLRTWWRLIKSKACANFHFTLGCVFSLFFLSILHHFLMHHNPIFEGVKLRQPFLQHNIKPRFCWKLPRNLCRMLS